MRTAVALTIVLTIAVLSLNNNAALSKELMQDETAQIYKKVAPATVLITTTSSEEIHSPESLVTGLGAGMLLDLQGLILTSSHVVDTAANIVVMLHDGTRIKADVVGSDPMTDVAVLRVALPKKPYTVAVLGDSDHLDIGQRVLAIGHPFGLSYALTNGIISGFVPITEVGGLRQNLIQTSAAINPGSSGGPLVTMDGHVIGINTAMVAGGQNIGFAIPIKTAKTVVAELVAHGRVIRPWLGITGKLVSEELRQLIALPLVKGLMIAAIAKESPAAHAGLQGGKIDVALHGEPWVLGGDILIGINEQEIRTAEQFASALKDLQVGQAVALHIVRAGTERTVIVTVDERPKSEKDLRSRSGEPKSTPLPLHTTAAPSSAELRF
jgi:S1-C subfamily serine protease